MTITKTLRILSLAGILAFAASFANAQDSSNITKQDALDFINKVLRECSLNDDSYSHYEGPGVATLDGCVLTITNKHTSPDGTMGWENTLRIDLSSVYLKVNSSGGNAWVCSSTKGDIWGRSHTVTINKRGKRKEYMDNHSSMDRINVNDLSVSNATGDLKSDILNGTITVNFIEMNATYKNQQYGKRLAKALSFLIVSCGGGKLKSDDSKF